MPKHPHPVEFVDGFLKEAEALKKPFGVGDVKRVSKKKVPKGPQVYSQPAPAVTRTQPELISNQKAVPPPPVA